jgi:membrane-associated phospholipid phosphatase
MIAVPQSRVIIILLAVPMLLSLVAMNYHFVSDVIAGSVLGAVVAMYAVHLARLKMA